MNPRIILTLDNRDLLTHPTLEQLRQLGLAGMARAFEELVANTRGADLDHTEWLGLLLDRELADRQDRRLRARLRYARLRHNAAVEDVDYRTARGLDRALFQKLAQGSWIKEPQNLIIVGPSGVGKSWLAYALGHRACPPRLRSIRLQRRPAPSARRRRCRGTSLNPQAFRRSRPLIPA
jgi:DNA replication protein DnaC